MQKDLHKVQKNPSYSKCSVCKRKFMRKINLQLSFISVYVGFIILLEFLFQFQVLASPEIEDFKKF